MELEDIEENPIKIEINEEEIFDKKGTPKKKRVLSDAQKEALAKGRARVKANRDAKRKEQLEKELAKEKKKEEAKAKRELAKEIKKKEAEGLKLQEKEKTIQKAEKKEKLSKQQETLNKIKQRKRQQQIDEFHTLKYKCLESLENEDTFKALDNILTKTITEDDICGDRDKLRAKVAKLIVDVRKKVKN